MIPVEKICWVDTREKLRREAEEKKRRVEREKRLMKLMVSRERRRTEKVL